MNDIGILQIRFVMTIFAFCIGDDLNLPSIKDYCAFEFIERCFRLPCLSSKHTKYKSSCRVYSFLQLNTYIKLLVMASPLISS